ncbi:hypothetical protein JAAARDRAFT_28557 [Jaapia argillacea MUCL 33604]|uniref:Uncharacterized protein n=1 Tax=Jaapia argillacea MUCL 33604 TaxID=933084 RepID=A0A067QFH7_9AGAM|nr:hypothetical protein JAAARDRAFT_28557 [Jaapia argillacea MUCL 33604]
MSLARTCLDLTQRRLHFCRIPSHHPFLTQFTAVRFKSSSTPEHVSQSEVDDCGIPLHPTWSVHDLISSYPKPSLQPSTLKKLHQLSALITPEEGSPEHQKLTEEMEDLIKLVEAVKLVDTEKLGQSSEGNEGWSVPDGRIWAEGTGIELDRVSRDEGDGVSGQALLKHAAKSGDGMYVVEADRRTN